MNIGMVTTFFQSGHRILVTGATKCVCIFQQNCNQFCQSEYISCLIICSPCFFFGSCSVINLFDRWIWRLMNYCYTFRVNISINHSIRQNTSRFAENGFDKVVRAKKQKPLLRKQIHWKERKKMISCFNWLFIAVEVILSRFHLFASSFHTHETAPLNSAANSLFCNW